MSKTVIAFDQSTNVSGFSIWKGGHLCKYGVIKANPKDSLQLRILFLMSEMNKLILEWNPDVLVFEDTTYNNGNVDLLKTLSKCLGCLEVFSIQLKRTFYTYKPSEWRGGKGFGRTRKQQKESAIQYVLDKYGIEATEDECEAICIGEYAVEKLEELE